MDSGNVSKPQVYWAYYLVSAEFLLRVIDRTYIYDANVAIAQLQTALREQLGVGVTVELIEQDKTILTVARDYAPDSEAVEALVDAAWDDAIHAIVLNFWLS